MAESVPAEGDPRRVQAVAKLMFDSIDQKLARIASIARAAEDRGLPGNLKSLTGVSRLLPGTEMVRSKEEGIQICDHYSSLLRMVEGHINTELKAAVRSAVDSDSLRLEDDAVGALAEARQVLASAERVFAGPRPRSVSSLQRQARIPPERPAPIRVEVREGKLRTANPKSSRGPMTAESVRRMLTSALETLSGALDSIRASSNVDRRFVPACEPLLRHLSRPYGEISVEALGHNWELVTDLLKGHRETIPDVPFTQIEQALRTVSVLINQYEEWRSYVAAQSIAGLSTREAQAAVYEAGAFAQELESHPESVDPEIVTRLKELVAPVMQGMVSADSVVAPLVASLSNVFAALARVAIDLGPTLVRAATDLPKGSQLLLFCLSVKMLQQFAPQLAQLGPLRFIRDAYELTMKHFPWAKDIVFK